MKYLDAELHRMVLICWARPRVWFRRGSPEGLPIGVHSRGASMAEELVIWWLLRWKSRSAAHGHPGT